MDSRIARRLLSALAFLAATSAAGPALPQLITDEFPRDLWEQRLRLSGDGLVACVYSESMLGDFNAAVAEALGDALLLDIKVESLDLLVPPEPLDYRIPLNEQELFLMMNGRCDIFMGFTFTTDYPTWLRLSVPYFSSPTVLVVRDPSYRSLADIPATRPLGTRIFSTTDYLLGQYTASLPLERRWQRYPYRNYGVAYERAVDGTVGGSLIWDAAAYFATEGDPEAAGLHLVYDLPFADPPVELSVGLRSDDDFLERALSQAIQSLAAEGVLHELAVAHHLAALDI
jgi:polar amino acid transport system substrate-binding protein